MASQDLNTWMSVYLNAYFLYDPDKELETLVRFFLETEVSGEFTARLQSLIADSTP